MDQDLSSRQQNHADYEHQSKLNALVEAEEFNLFALLNPRIFIDGDQWCVLHGENLQDGVAGFGSTPYLAVIDFNKSWHVPAFRKGKAV